MASVIRAVCVYCGSRSGNDAAYADAARAFGSELARRGCALIYGGGSVGLMGVVADAALDAGGRVVGVIPQRLATKELLHPRVADMRLVPDMHARKALMAELADAFVALPGGYGTLEELFETVTWAQLGIHRKPIGLLNTNGFFDPLIRLVEHTIDTGFIRSDHRQLLATADTAAELLDRLASHELPATRKWLDANET